MKKLIERHLKSASGSSLDASSAECYRPKLMRFLTFLEEKGIESAKKVTPDHFDDFAQYMTELQKENGKPLANKTIKLHYVAVRNFFKWLLRIGVLEVDPSSELKNPKLPDTIPRNLLTPKEIEETFDLPDLSTAIGFRDRTIMELVYASAIHRSEVSKLDLPDVDIETELLLVRGGKHKKDGYIPLLPRTIHFLKEYRDGPRVILTKKKPKEIAFFVNRRGGRLDKDSVSQLFRKYAKDSKIEKEISAMSFRHAIATHLLQNGMGIRHIQRLLLHKKVSTTEIYTRVTPVDVLRQIQKFHPR